MRMNGANDMMKSTNKIRMGFEMGWSSAGPGSWAKAEVVIKTANIVKSIKEVHHLAKNCDKICFTIFSFTRYTSNPSFHIANLAHKILAHAESHLFARNLNHVNPLARLQGLILQHLDP